jgi:hypothetical protein
MSRYGARLEAYAINVSTLVHPFGLIRTMMPTAPKDRSSDSFVDSVRLSLAVRVRYFFFLFLCVGLGTNWSRLEEHYHH